MSCSFHLENTTMPKHAIQKIDKPSVRMLREEIDKTLAALGKTYGVCFKTGNASFTENTIRFQLEASLLAGGHSFGIAGDMYMNFAKDQGLSHGIKPEWLGKTFWSRWSDGIHYEYRVEGMNRTGKILARSVGAGGDNKVYLFPQFRVVESFAKPPKPEAAHA